MIADFVRVQPDDQSLKSNYLVTLRMIERLHRLLLDLIKDEFERVGRTDVNSVQALLLFNIGDVELTAGELKTRGLYLGSNVSYNLKKLVESGYIHHQRSRTDKRSVRVKLTDKGKAISEMVNRLLERQLNMLEKVGGVSRSRPQALQPNLGEARTLLGRPNPLPAVTTEAASADGDAALSPSRIRLASEAHKLRNADPADAPPDCRPHSFPLS